MNQNADQDKQERAKAEFDLLADEYHDMHKNNITVSGEDPDFFAEYKIADLAALAESKGIAVRSIFDFGCGIGNSIPFFRKYFPDAAITCGDVSERSMEIAKTRFPGNEAFSLIDRSIPLGTASQDVVFTACVFHHIPHDDHAHWLQELRRITRPGGLLAIYEHNPLNPLTVKAVNTCPLDVNAKLILGRSMGQRAVKAGWTQPEVSYKIFFPSVLKKLRPLEKRLTWLPLGAQYVMSARA
jgi:SAM-dependent methyltransferase